MPLTYISKVSALTILALSIAACSSGGNHTQISPNTPPLTDQSAAAQKVEANRLVLLDQAKKAGLSAQQAAAYAEANKQATDKAAKTALATLVAEKAAAKKAAAEKAALIRANEIKTKALKGVYDRDANDVADGYTNQSFYEDSLNSKGQYSLREGFYHVYQQPYSIIIGTWLTTDIKDDVNQLAKNSATYNVDIAGLATQAIAIPTVGKATYTGLGTHLGSGHDLTYNVDFTKRTGSGYFIRAKEYGGKISLDEGTIAKINLKGNQVIGISSSAKALDGTSGKYSLGFYGTEAQDIAGSLEMDRSGIYSYKNINGKTEIGFGGTRGEISK